MRCLSLSVSVLSVALSLSALAAGPVPLKLSKLQCRVTEGAPNYPAGSSLGYDARSDEILSAGFYSNIKLRHPQIIRGMLGNMGIGGEGFAEGPFGLFPFDITLSLDSDSIDRPVSLRGVKVKLLTSASQARFGTPDAELDCDLTIVQDKQ